MLEKLIKLAKFIGNTPLINLEGKKVNLYAKLEYNNFSGSSKDRAAYSILRDAILTGKIDKRTTIVASSSGNFAISIASICCLLKIKFIPVVDPNINSDYEALLSLLSYKMIKVSVRDETGGFLLTRINTVQQVCYQIKNSFFADQYSDPNNCRGYYDLGNEILSALDIVDFIFIAVSSGGAITGISTLVKKRNHRVKIIAVDVKGSVIFGHAPEKRFISGIGSSQASPIMKDAIIDEVIHVSQCDIVVGCYELLREQVIFGGASSGAVYFAAKRYFQKFETEKRPVAVLIFPDKGSAYLDTIYNKDWEKGLIEKLKQPIHQE